MRRPRRRANRSEADHSERTKRGVERLQRRSTLFRARSRAGSADFQGQMRPVEDNAMGVQNVSAE